MWLLGAGAAAGLAFAAAGLLERGDPSAELPSESVALVNGVPLRAEDHARLVAAVQSDTRGAVGDDARAAVLERMIEEELLVQRALELGLARADRRVRADLVSAVIAAVTADAEGREPSELELRAFYRDERDFFASPGRLRLRQVFFRVPGPERETEVAERAERAARRLRTGEAFEKVRDELGDAEISPVPDTLLPPQKLIEYLGPTALRTALQHRPGEITGPVRSGTGYHVISVVERESEHRREFEEIEETVRAEWMRRAGERALRRYLEELKGRATIVRRFTADPS